MHDAQHTPHYQDTSAVTSSNIGVYAAPNNAVVGEYTAPDSANSTPIGVYAPPNHETIGFYSGSSTANDLQFQTGLLSLYL